MSKLSVNVNAKINLSLNVTGVSNNGYHYLDMVVASVNIADAIAISRRRDRDITCRITYGGLLKDNGEIDPKNNTAVRAAKLFVKSFDTCGYDISITKNIPLSGGLGGSSADASAVIKACGSLCGIDIKDPKIAAIALECGSDVMLQMSNGYKRVTGIGERIENINRIPVYDIVIAKDAGGVNSRDSYNRYDNCKTDKINCDNDRLIDALRKRNFAGIKKNMYNSLYEASVKLEPAIEKTLERLSASGAKAVLMSGSGSACFGLYENEVEAQRAAAELADLEYVIAAKTVNDYD